MSCFFDFDGVIVDTTKIKHQLFINIALEQGFKDIGRLDDALKTKLVGAERKQVASWIKDQAPCFSTEAFLRAFASETKSIEKNLTLTAGFSAFIDLLQKNKVNYYIISSAPWDDIIRMLTFFKIDTEKFSGIYGGGRKQKILAEILKTEVKKPTNCIFFGDMPSDQEVATTLDVPFCRVRSHIGNLCSWNGSVSETITNFRITKKLRNLCQNQIGIDLLFP